tara:strand:+ start:877 stop:1116 length:240 start_codon:yes stop_codon:yes gene_type:complete
MESAIIDLLKRVITTSGKLIEYYSTIAEIKENPSKTKCNCGNNSHHKTFGQKMVEAEITAEIKVLKKSFNLLFGTMEVK